METGAESSDTARPRRPRLDEIETARTWLAAYMPRTPLIQLDLGLPDRRIFLKLETLSPIGAFKLRPALNALLSRDIKTLRSGVATASSGNMAYGMAWAAHRLGVPMAAYMYSGAPRAKIDGVRKLGGEVRFISMETWWRYIIDAERPELDELLINPVTDQAVLIGNGTIGLEIVEDLPEVDVVVTPFGGGSLTTGVASAVKALCPEAKIIAAEDEQAAPVTAALAAGGIVEIETVFREEHRRPVARAAVVAGREPADRRSGCRQSQPDRRCDAAPVLERQGWGGGRGRGFSGGRPCQRPHQRQRGVRHIGRQRRRGGLFAGACWRHSGAVNCEPPEWLGNLTECDESSRFWTT